LCSSTLSARCSTKYGRSSPGCPSTSVVMVLGCSSSAALLSMGDARPAHLCDRWISQGAHLCMGAHAQRDSPFGPLVPSHLLELGLDTFISSVQDLPYALGGLCPSVTVKCCLRPQPTCAQSRPTSVPVSAHVGPSSGLPLAYAHTIPTKLRTQWVTTLWGTVQ